jgi:hypothetical protein
MSHTSALLGKARDLAPLGLLVGGQGKILLHEGKSAPFRAMALVGWDHE